MVVLMTVKRPRIARPLEVPVVGTDAHLSAVAADQLTPAALRQRFVSPPIWHLELPGDGSVFEGRQPAAASVLVPLVVRETGLQVLLTRRTDHLHDHAGQISFPGGRQDPEDRDERDTALREAEEEVGLQLAQIEVLGHLPTYTTVTNFVVTPVVALVHPPFELRLDSFEVAEAFEVPLQFLMSPAHHRRHRFDFDGGQHQFLSMPWSGVEREYFIWGATAAMLRNLYRFLAA
jgi:8-oxo-dGTP pyrophosphatase MutT (NUDIX family)